MANLLDDSEISRNLLDFEVSSSDGQEAAFVNALPPELLVYIFEIAQIMLLPSEHLFRHFPLVLGDVSHYWRQVAFGAPMLWSNVDISHPRDLTVLRTYLDKSKDYPIDLHFTYDITLVPDEKADPSEVDQLIGILQPHYFHCRSIRLSSGMAYPQATPEMVSLLESMCDGHYPMLQSFLVEGADRYDMVESCAILNDAPNLTNVRLGGLGLSYCRPPLNAVTELHLAVADNIMPYTDFSKML
jgi:hypothetical protein